MIKKDGHKKILRYKNVRYEYFLGIENLGCKKLKIKVIKKISLKPKKKYAKKCDL